MAQFQLPTCENLELRIEGSTLHVDFARPKARNAMSFAMVEELLAVFDAVKQERACRAIVLRGQGGNFCAGGDIKDMAGARMAGAPAEGEVDPLATANRRFGTMVEAIDRAPQAVIVVAEGAVMGGGFGLLCVSDVAIVVEGAKLRLPETSLGIVPAQIAPFIVRRIGLTQARRFAVTGGRIDARQSVDLGLAHAYAADAQDAQTQLEHVLAQIRKCAPGAVAITKALMLDAPLTPIAELLDRGSLDFAAAARGPEGVAGMGAFIQKSAPPWAAET